MYKPSDPFVHLTCQSERSKIVVLPTPINARDIVLGSTKLLEAEIISPTKTKDVDLAFSKIAGLNESIRRHIISQSY